MELPIVAEHSVGYLSMLIHYIFQPISQSIHLSSFIFFNAILHIYIYYIYTICIYILCIYMCLYLNYIYVNIPIFFARIHLFGALRRLGLGRSWCCKQARRKWPLCTPCGQTRKNQSRAFRSFPWIVSSASGPQSCWKKKARMRCVQRNSLGCTHLRMCLQSWMLWRRTWQAAKSCWHQAPRQRCQLWRPKSCPNWRWRTDESAEQRKPQKRKLQHHPPNFPSSPWPKRWRWLQQHPQQEILPRPMKRVSSDQTTSDEASQAGMPSSALSRSFWTWMLCILQSSHALTSSPASARWKWLRGTNAKTSSTTFRTISSTNTFQSDLRTMGTRSTALSRRSWWNCKTQFLKGKDCRSWLRTASLASWRGQSKHDEKKSCWGLWCGVMGPQMGVDLKPMQSF